MPNKKFKEELNIDDLLFTNVKKDNNQEANKIKKNSESTNEIEPQDDDTTDKYADILNGIKSAEEKGANTAFYLSRQTIDLLNNVAKKKGVSRSRIVDEILRRVLTGR